MLDGFCADGSAYGVIEVSSWRLVIVRLSFVSTVEGGLDFRCVRRLTRMRRFD